MTDTVGAPIEVLGRIVGVKQIRNAPSRLGRYRALMATGALMGLVGMVPLGIDIVQGALMMSAGQLPRFSQLPLHMVLAFGVSRVGVLIAKVAALLFDREAAAIGEASGARVAGAPAPAA